MNTFLELHPKLNAQGRQLASQVRAMLRQPAKARMRFELTATTVIVIVACGLVIGHVLRLFRFEFATGPLEALRKDNTLVLIVLGIPVLVILVYFLFLGALGWWLFERPARRKMQRELSAFLSAHPDLLPALDEADLDLAKRVRKALPTARGA